MAAIAFSRLEGYVVGFNSSDRLFAQDLIFGYLSSLDSVIEILDSSILDSTRSVFARVFIPLLHLTYSEMSTPEAEREEVWGLGMWEEQEHQKKPKESQA